MTKTTYTTRTTTKDYILVFFLLFNVLYTFINLYLGLGCCLLIATCLLFTNSLSKTNKYESYLLRMAFIVLLYTIIISIVNLQFSPYTLGRHTRICIVLLAFIVIVNTYLKKKSPKLLINVFITLGLLNVCFIFAEIISPTFKEFMYSLMPSGHEFELMPLRASGLCGDFEGCGLINACLMVLLTQLYIKTKNKGILIFLIITFASCFFVSRTAMLLGLFVFALNLFFISKNDKKFFWLIIVPVLCAIFIFVVVPIYNQVMDNAIGAEGIGVESSYGNSTNALLGTMLVLPDTFEQILVGTGETIETSDIGYVKLIFMVGIIGLGLIIILYIGALNILRNSQIMDEELKLLRCFVGFVFILLLMMNYKLLYLYSRSVSDMFFLFSMYLYSRNLYLTEYEKIKCSPIQ